MDFESRKNELDEQWSSLQIPSNIDSDDENSAPSPNDTTNSIPKERSKSVKISGEELVALRRREKSLLIQEVTLDSAVALGLSEATFKLYVTLPNGNVVAHELPTRYTVDQAKRDLLTVEFVKIVKAHKMIDDLVREEKPVHLELVSLKQRLNKTGTARKAVSSSDLPRVPSVESIVQKQAPTEIAVTHTAQKESHQAKQMSTPVPDLPQDDICDSPPKVEKLEPIEEDCQQVPQHTPLIDTEVQDKPIIDVIPEVIPEVTAATETPLPEAPVAVETEQAKEAVQEAIPVPENLPPDTSSSSDQGEGVNNKPVEVSEDVTIAAQKTEPDTSITHKIEPVVPDPLLQEAITHKEADTVVLEPPVVEVNYRVVPPRETRPVQWVKIKPARTLREESSLQSPVSDPNSSVTAPTNDSASAATTEVQPDQPDQPVQPVQPVQPTRGLSLRTVSAKTRLRKQATIPDHPMIMEMEGYVRYTASKPVDTSGHRVNFANATGIIDLEKDFNYYQEVLYEKEHINLIADQQGNNGPYIISIAKSKIDNEYPIIVWSPSGEERIMIPSSHFKSRAFGGEPRTKEKVQALKQRKPDLPYAQLKRIDEIDFPKELYKLESSQKVASYKFGVLYAKQGQTDENDMFGNTQPSPLFEEFLSVIGDTVVLKGWSHYRGGLDVKTNTTGQQSVYTKFCNFEVMFHVSTMLPFYPADKQQLERKRHIGNDICVIIFMEGKTLYSPKTLTSEFNNAKNQTCYKMEISVKEGVPPFGPPLQEFYTKEQFRDHFLTKLINAERASYYAAVFSNKIQRTRRAMLNEIVKNRLK